MLTLNNRLFEKAKNLNWNFLLDTILDALVDWFMVCLLLYWIINSIWIIDSYVKYWVWIW